MGKVILTILFTLLITGCSDQNSSGNGVICKEAGSSCSEDGSKIVQCELSDNKLSGKEIPCKESEICWQGNCIDNSCPDSCTPGSDSCLDETTPLLCKDSDGDGCFQYEQTTCPADQKCSDGGCYTTECTDICTKGEKKCVNDFRAQQCGNTDSDICTEWNLIICSGEQVCLNGECVDQPECTTTCGANSSCVFEDGEAFCGCRQNFADANNDPTDGCECEYSNSKVEICDGLDNDCDGVIDDGGDALCINHLAHATSICDTLDTNRCIITSCDDGWIDLNQNNSDGCEHPVGNCASDCHNIHGTAYCSGESCILGCETGWSDFDGITTNGCESGCYWYIHHYPLTGGVPITANLTSDTPSILTLDGDHNTIRTYTAEGYPDTAYALNKTLSSGAFYHRGGEQILIYPHSDSKQYLQPLSLNNNEATPLKSPLALGENLDEVRLSGDQSPYLLTSLSSKQLSMSWFDRTEYTLTESIKITPESEQIFTHKTALTGDTIGVVYCFQDNENEEKVGVRYLNYQGTLLDDKTVVVAGKGYCDTFGDTLTIVATADRFYLSFHLPEVSGVVFQEHHFNNTEVEIISKLQTDELVSGATLYTRDGYLLWSGYHNSTLSYRLINIEPFKTISTLQESVTEELKGISAYLTDQLEVKLVARGITRGFLATTYPCHFDETDCNDLFCHSRVGYYPFENKLDEQSGYSYTPIWSGGIPKFTTTPFGQGIELIQGQQLTGSGVWLPSRGTISFWLNVIQSPSTAVNLLTLDSESSSPLKLTLNHQQLNFQINTVTGVHFSATPVQLELEQWQLITIRIDHHQIELLINDSIQELIEISPEAPMIRDGIKWHIGTSLTDPEWHLILDQLRLYQQPLSLSEIKTIYQERH